MCSYFCASGTSTPVPDDAPSSVQAISSARKQIRAEQKKRMFPTVEYKKRVSHFDPESQHSDFRGFFVLFWVGLAIMVITAMFHNLKETGKCVHSMIPHSDRSDIDCSLFPFRQKDLFLENIWELAFSDLTMTASTMLNLPLHKLYADGPEFLRWRKGGVWVQSALQGLWLFYWVEYVLDPAST